MRAAIGLVAPRGVDVAAASASAATASVGVGQLRRDRQLRAERVHLLQIARRARPVRLCRSASRSESAVTFGIAVAVAADPAAQPQEALRPLRQQRAPTAHTAPAAPAGTRRADRPARSRLRPRRTAVRGAAAASATAARSAGGSPARSDRRRASRRARGRASRISSAMRLRWSIMLLRMTSVGCAVSTGTISARSSSAAAASRVDALRPPGAAAPPRHRRRIGVRPPCRSSARFASIENSMKPRTNASVSSRLSASRPRSTAAAPAMPR